MKPFLYYIIVLPVLLFSVGRAQETKRVPELEFLDEGSIHQIIVATHALGAGASEAYVRQVDPHRLASGTEVRQTGDRNVVGVDVQGPNHGTRITQYGSSNAALTRMLGAESSSDILQFGTNNIVNQYLAGRGHGYKIAQYGNGHEMIHVETGRGIRGLEITQSGSASTLYLINGSVRVPIGGGGK